MNCVEVIFKTMKRLQRSGESKRWMYIYCKSSSIVPHTSVHSPTPQSKRMLYSSDSQETLRANDCTHLGSPLPKKAAKT